MSETAEHQKFCKYYGKEISEDAVICIHCGRQVEEIKQSPGSTAPTPNIVINNANTNANFVGAPGVYGHPKNKWVAFCLCLFLGLVGAHKFYEGKIGMGILYVVTGGLCGIGTLIDLIVILTKPNPYYV